MTSTGRAAVLRSLRSGLWLLAGCAFFIGCAEDDADEIARGRGLFATRELSSSRLNHYACTSCHTEHATAGGFIATGAPLAGVTLRPSYWGAQENDLLRSINACLRQFMGQAQPLSQDDANARAVYAYLKSLEPGDSAPVAFTVVREIAMLPRGSAARGEPLYARACLGCHGALHDGSGRISDRVPVLPDQTLAEHADYSKRDQRLVFIEKTRHGGFLGYGGDMPPFSAERLSDAEVSDLLELFEVFDDTTP